MAKGGDRTKAKSSGAGAGSGASATGGGAIGGGGVNTSSVTPGNISQFLKRDTSNFVSPRILTAANKIKSNLFKLNNMYFRPITKGNNTKIAAIRAAGQKIKDKTDPQVYTSANRLARV